MSEKTTPLHLDEGIWFEDIDQLIPWDTSFTELEKRLSPKVLKQPESIHLTWENHTCFHIPCDVSACQLLDEPNPRAYHICLDTFHWFSCEIRDIKTYHPADTAKEFKQIYNYLWQQFGDPTFYYPKYFENLPAIYWDFENLLIGYSASGRNSFTISVSHEPDGYDDLKKEALEIRLREGEGLKVTHLDW